MSFFYLLLWKDIGLYKKACWQQQCFLSDLVGACIKELDISPDPLDATSAEFFPMLLP